MKRSSPVSLLELVHGRPGITRVEAARILGMSSGLVTETTARLVGWHLLAEAPASPTGRRGRPTTSLLPHPDGPLVAVAVIAHETWQVAAVALGGGVVASREGRHRGALAGARRVVRAGLAALHDRYGSRVQAYVVAVPGTVTGTRLLHAPNLEWRNAELATLRPVGAAGAPLLAGNDATFAGVAEYRRGAAAGTGTAIHLYLDAGVGGAYLDGGRTILGATRTAGEFGHMPFGDPSRACRCGAHGCWNTALDGEAVARLLGQPPPADQVSYTRQVLAAAGEGGPERLAVEAVAGVLGRGAAALVNALDPDIVTVGGLGRHLLDVAGSHARRAYDRGLMDFRSAAPPPIVASHFGASGPLVGAADEGFATFLDEQTIRRWASSGAA